MKKGRGTINPKKNKNWYKEPVTAHELAQVLTWLIRTTHEDAE